MSLRVGVWPPCDEATLALLRASPGLQLVEALPRHRWPALFWARRLVSPLLGGADALEEALSSWPARLFDLALGCYRSGARGWLVALLLLLPLCWLGVAASQLLLAAVRFLLAPARGYEAVAALLEGHPSMLLSPEEQVRLAGCDVWLVPPRGGFPYPQGVKAVALVGGADRLAREQARLWATLVVPCDLECPLAALREAANRAAPADPLPGLLALPAALPAVPHAHLFLPSAYQGGTWEAARTLVAGLVEVNRSRRQMVLSLAVPADQPLTGLDVPEEDLAVERLSPRRVGEYEVPFSPSLLRAGVWFALADRFAAPLLPARPYGLVLHDVVHRFLPESYPLDFHTRLWPALRETVRGAARAIATTEATRRDVLEAFGLPAERVALVPVACEPRRRFAGLVPRPAPVKAPFLLNPTNAAPHKGAEVMLEGYALLRRRLPGCPPLVLCGNDTERLAPGARGGGTSYWGRVRRLVSRLGLRPGEDVHFLGYVDDAGLMGLLQSAAVVINAARHDNGTYALIEGHYFGRPAVSSRYAAAEELYGRFGVPVRYFAPECPRSLAEALEQALLLPALQGEALEQARSALAAPELGLRRYAERVYDLLLELANGGVSRRLAA